MMDYVKVEAREEKKGDGANLKAAATVLLLGGLLAVGIFIGVLVSNTYNTDDTYNTCSLSGTDKNFLINLEYRGGTCERMGLIPKVIIQYDRNNAYGVPICIESPDLNQQVI